MLPSSHVYSSLLGYIALGTCTAISLPQMFSHWKRKKAEGISLTMLWLWLIGDLFGLAGTVVQGLLRTQASSDIDRIILGVINAIIDACIIWQCYYYNNFAQFRHILVAWRRVTSKTHPAIVDNRPSAVSPHDPNGSADADTITGGIVHRKDEENLSPDLSLRKTKTMSTLTPRSPTIHLPLVTEENRKKRLSIMYHIIYIVIVVGISILVWGVAVERVRKTATLKDGEDGTDPKFSSAGATFGWISMVIYS
ncbi:hypothetical protein FRB96_007359 [Tulasnella sp. 330]|nr:hypothetical protein FRB96_007359 [Tulasnella sp. 330]KAG8871892.1 hypothetical protein FRB97_008231 [Tulasnella sp. 331]KAG8874980.1 hypothetical protein FRB98_008130 [Tulasnella sp. 332]